MKAPSAADAARCIELRVQSKQGRTLSKEDQKFVEKMFKKYPEWYSDINREVFIRSAPFGSNW